MAASGLASPATVHALRLRPGEDLLASLGRFRVDHGLKAAAIVTCVGSLTRAALRFANKPTTTVLEGHFEIVSLVGTLSPDGDHVHISISDGEGRTTGGHLMGGSLVYTTAEIMLLEADALAFSRPIDPATTYDELVVTPRTMEASPAPVAPAGDATAAAAAPTSGSGSGGGGAAAGTGTS